MIGDTSLNIEDAMSSAGYGVFQIIAMIFFCLSLIGYCATATMLSFLSPCAQITMNLTSTQTSILAGVIFVGQLIGVLTFGSCADIVGRKASYLASVCLVAFFNAGIFFSNNFEILCCCIAMIGFGSGGSSIAHSYVAEIMPVKYRGSALVLLGIMCGTGTVFISGGAWLVLGIFQLDWHFLALLTTALFAISIIGVCTYIPESPRWLHANLRSQDALVVLKYVAKRNGNTWDESVSLQPPQQESKAHDSNIWGSILNPRSKYPTFSLCFVGIIANFTFACLILIVPYFLENSDVDSKACSFDFPYIFFSSLAQPICSSLAIYAIEKSRRIPNMLSFLFASMLFLILGTGISRILFLVVAFITRGLVSITNNIFWTIVPEYYPTKIRATMMGIFYAIICLAMSTASFWVYAPGTSKEEKCAFLSAICLFALILIYFFLKETAGEVLDGDEKVVTEEDAENSELLPSTTGHIKDYSTSSN